MVERSKRTREALLCALALLAATAHAAAAARGPYDEHADARASIRAALAGAKAAHKRVLVDFGANWCEWCRGLQALFSAPGAIARELDDGFVLVLVDVGEMNRNLDMAAAYGVRGMEDTGIPMLVVLDDEGRVIKVQNAGDLETDDESGYAKDAVLAFLRAARKGPS